MADNLSIKDSANADKTLRATDNDGVYTPHHIALGLATHDADGTGSAPVLIGGYASATAPTSVSADGDAVRSWHLRNGAQAVVITAAGALIPGDAANGMDVDVTRINGVAPAFGSGSVGSTVLRVVAATDSPEVTALGGTSDSAATAGSTGSISAKLRTVTAQLNTLNQSQGGDYETVAASQTTQTLGATGASGDFLSGLLVIPATTSPGAVQIKDGSNTAITVFTGGASSVTNLVPFFVPIGARSVQGAWQVTTNSNVSVIAFGDFT